MQGMHRMHGALAGPPRWGPLEALREKTGPGDPGETPEGGADEALEGGGSKRVLACAACRTPLTRESARIRVMGGHRHTFFNPSGRLFDLGCFSMAVNLAGAGPVSSEFTWFPGHVWQAVVCTGCLDHLGWRFTEASGVASFFGLILDRLVEVEEGGG